MGPVRQGHGVAGQPAPDRRLMVSAVLATGPPALLDHPAATYTPTLHALRSLRRHCQRRCSGVRVPPMTMSSMTMPGQPLLTLELPCAPPVTTSVATPLSRPKGPALGLLGLGVLLVFGPLVWSFFAKTAAGEQMVDQFAPYMKSTALARYDNDIKILHNGATSIDTIYRRQDIPRGQFPGLDDFRHHSTAIVTRASTLLSRVRGAQGEYEQVARIGGFDRIPFLIVASGIVSIYGACVLLGGRRSRARPAAGFVVLASVAIGIYPFVSGLNGGAQAGQRMLHSLAPVMTPHEVRQLQDDFIVLVNADGELATTFRSVPRSGQSATAIATLVHRWPGVSSDFASLVGVINNNISNFNSLNDLGALTHDVGLPGLEAFPWLFVGVGAASAGLAVGALPRRRKESS
jgi:hypothetical protein